MSLKVVPSERAMDLLISVYSQATDFKEYLNIIFEVFDDVATAANDCNTRRYITTAFGIQLDVLAEIVGTNRVISGAAPLGFFGFYANATALGMGDVTNPNVGGRFRGEGEQEIGDLELSDAQLQRVILAKVIKNTRTLNVDDCIEYIETVLGYSVDIQITRPANGQMHVQIHVILDLSDRALIAAVLKEIKPAGVTMTLADNNGSIDLPDTQMTYTQTAYAFNKLGGSLYLDSASTLDNLNTAFGS